MGRKLSAIVVTYNEAHRIEKCLRDLRDVVDEIVVVDQGSTDATGIIASKIADRFLADKHWGFCEASREMAYGETSGDWVLVMDADEVLTPRMKQEIRGLINVSNPPGGYRLKRELYIDGEHAFTGDSHYRLFRREHVRFLKELHVEPQPIGSVVNLDFVCISHRKTMQEQLSDDLRYQNMLDADPNISPDLRAAKTALQHRLHAYRAEHGKDPKI